MTSTIIATFDKLDDAQRAVEALTTAGFNRSDIGLATQDIRNRDVSGTSVYNDTTSARTDYPAGTMGGTALTGAGQMGGAAAYNATGLTDDARTYGTDAERTYATNTDKTYVGDNDVVHNPDDMSGSEGAGLGAVFGTMVGAVAGLVAIAIPGVGPIIAAGPLAAVLGAAAGAGIGAASGAVTGGVTASLVQFGVPEDDAHYYAESLRQGGAIVSVTAHAQDADRATHILQQYNPVDIDQRVTQWRTRGWKGFDDKVDGFKSADRIEAEGMGAVEAAPNPAKQAESDADYAARIRRYNANSD